MLMLNFFTSLLIFSLYLIHFAYGASESHRIWKFQNCSFENVEGCARIVMLYGARELILPDNEKDMVPHCAEEKTAVKCVRDWTRKCLKGFPRQLLQVIMNGPGRNINERCAPAGTKWYLSNSKCVIDSAPLIHDCMDVLKEEVNAIRRNPRTSEWLPTGCCYFEKFNQCFDKAMLPYCNKEGQKFMNWCRSSYISDLTDLACPRDHNFGGPKCNRLIKRIPKAPENSTESAPISVVGPIYKMFMTDGLDFDNLKPK